MNDRLKNPAAWIGFSILAIGIVIHGALISPGAAKALQVVSELLGLAGAWFFGAGMMARPDGVSPPSDKLPLPPVSK